MSKRMKLALAGLLLGVGLVFAACDAPQAAKDALQTSYTLSQATPVPGGLNLSQGSK